jgi:uncharacterized protein (DUF58 family)
VAGAGGLLRTGTDFAPAPAELARAVRRLDVRSRREAGGAFAGGYRSAFRGGGLEFEESRPYAAGDDVRAIDWNAYARSGALFVKRWREERDQTLWLVVDVSASMGFGSAGPSGSAAPSKAALAARSAALLAAAARAAGDRVGLLAFDERVVHEVAPGRGEAHGLTVLRALVESGRAGTGRTALAPVLGVLRERSVRRAIVFLLSDLRDPLLLGAGAEARRTRALLSAVARRHDVVAGWIHDPLEASLPAAGTLRLADPEAPSRTFLLRSGSRRVRERYARAARAEAQLLARRLAREGIDRVRLSTGADPLLALGRFFAMRAERRVLARRPAR